jgi:histidinol-phosphatase (PHP family)
MNYNFHTHTFRCGHATGIERNYIENSIKAGVKKLGFSEHAPFRHDDGFESSYRVQTAMVKDYFDTLKALREEYKDKIEIFIGFEIEYYYPYFDKMVKYALDEGAEYFILGQHHVDTDRFDGKDDYRFFNIFIPNDDESALTGYINAIINAVKSGYISYVAHPDAFNFTGDVEFYKREYARLIKACKEYNVPLEINCYGIRDNRHYPRKELWELVGEIGAPVVTGMDAHSEESAYDEGSLKFVELMVKTYNLNFLRDFNVKILNK